jgi:hypothetical protein
MSAKMTDEQLVDWLAETYPGEVPSNEQIADWVAGIREKAWRYDQISAGVTTEGSS